MFNVKHPAQGVAEALGEPLDDARLGLLERYGRWLSDEAVAAGGLGPGEGARIPQRHLADSVAFGRAVPPITTPVLDLGSGVGLPGIPLAILRPQCRFILADRSGRRADLAGRAVEILGLSNVEVRHVDATAIAEVFPGVVMRAALPVGRAWPILARLLGPGGVAAVGWSATGARPSEEQEAEMSLHARTVGLDVEVLAGDGLDSRSVILRITRT